MDNITTFRPRHFLRPFAVLACGLGVAPLMGVQCQPVVGPLPKACSEVFEPVCGIDGRTYGNRCEAEAAGVDVAHEGACDGCRPVRCGCAHGRMEIDSSTGCPSCRCGPSFCMNDEECGIGEYCDRSECASPCAPVEICSDVCYGTCRVIPELCPEIYAPVCGADGRTYGNRCEAERAMVAVLHEGECRGDWVCPEVYEPVCGENGRTYSNLCYAKRAGVSVVHMGECDGDACGRIVCTLHCENGFESDPETGCAICACRMRPWPRVGDCTSDEECREDEYCDHSECLSPPCPPGEPCPTVCYGLCRLRT